MGPVPGLALGRLPSPRLVGDAGLQLSGLAGMVAARALEQTEASRFFSRPAILA